MQFLGELITGLVLAHVIWALFYGTGTLMLTSFRSVPVPFARRDVLDGLVRTAYGGSAFIFAIFLLAAAGALRGTNLIALAIVLPAFLFATSARATGARATIAELTAPWSKFDGFAAALYVLAVVLFAPALLAPVDFDPGMYHLAHAVDWARAGRLYVDPYVRFPLFAYNVELLYASLFALGLRTYVQVIDWLAFLWSVLALYGLTRYLVGPKLAGRPAMSGVTRWLAPAPLVSFVAALVYCVSPVVLHYVDTAYVEMAIGYFFIALIVASILAIERDRSYAFCAAAIGGSLIGMKLPLAALAPLIFALLAYVGVVTRSSRKRVTAWIATFAVVGAPWYLRNMLIAGDPLSPVLNIALRRADPFWTPQDYLNAQLSIQSIRQMPLFAPVLQFVHPSAFSEFGASLNICFLFVPVIVAVLMLVRPRLRLEQRGLFILCGSTGYAICFVYFVSQYLRYSIEFYAAFISALAGLTVWLTAAALGRFAGPGRARAAAAASAVILAATAIPSPADSDAFLGITGRYHDIGANVIHPAAYFASSVPGYSEATEVCDVVGASGLSGTVLALRLESLAYTFRDRGIVSIGDWFGPARYADLRQAVDRSAVASYLRRFDVVAVMVGPGEIGWSDAEKEQFLQQVRRAGYPELPHSGSPIRTFIRSDVIQAASRRRLPQHVSGGEPM